MVNFIAKLVKCAFRFRISESVLFILLKSSIIVFLPLFILSMLILPWFNQDWQYLQKVWHNWQGFNVGMLAFLSTGIIYIYSHTKSEEQRIREFRASLAFLPSALSSISSYLCECISMIQEAYDRVALQDKRELKRTLEFKLPTLPQDFQQAFKECIKNANEKEGELLSDVLQLLQIQHSRLNSLYYKEICPEPKFSPNIVNIQEHFLDVAHLKALVDILFDYARGEAVESYEVDRFKIASALNALDVKGKYIELSAPFFNSRYKGKSFQRSETEI